MKPDDGPFLPHGGYLKLRSYKVAEAVYDATVVFCRRFHADDKRQREQMVQAARSGVRNISEGSGLAATSRKSEMKLTNVARASINDELIRDFESFLRDRGLRVWPKESREALAMRKLLYQDKVVRKPSARAKIQLTGLQGLSDFVAEADPELAANAMICAANQAAYLLKRQLTSQGKQFLKGGGFTEKLYGARKRTLKSDDKDPVCPECGKDMRKRKARTGPGAGKEFWGCKGYPACRGTRPVYKSDLSD
jgi:restriction system protein